MQWQGGYSQASIVDDLDYWSDTASLELGGCGCKRAIAEKDCAFFIASSARSLVSIIGLGSSHGLLHVLDVQLCCFSDREWSYSNC